MAVYNGARHLREAVESILGQTFQDFEFVVVNDGSTDESRTILSSFGDPRIRVLDNPSNLGLTKSLNVGLGVARADLIARQDADDISDEGRLEKQVAVMDAHPGLALLGTQARYVDEKGTAQVSRLWWKATTTEGLRFQLLFDSPFVHTSVMFRKSIVQDVL